MNFKRRNNIILCAFSAIAMTASFPALAQQVIDGGQSVQVPADQSSPWDAGSSLTIGQTGTGSLTISDGATVTNAMGTIGELAGSDGRVTVSGPSSTWENALPLTVGQGGKGQLNVADGGYVSAAELHIGQESGAEGIVNVSGAAYLQSQAELYVGEQGKGTLNITDGGQVHARIGLIGLTPGSSGSVLVDGASSLFIYDPLGDDHLYVGQSGNGSLTISNGALVMNATGYLGYAAGSSGTALVTGADSTWANSGDLIVGREGNGTLVIADGGNVSSVQGFVGQAAGSTGSVTVTGTDSSWTNMLPLSVGYGGTGVLNVDNGGAVSAAEVAIGVEAGANGIVNVGRNATLTSAADFNVGVSGNGALNITDGGKVSARIAMLGLTSGSSGSVRVDGPGSALSISDPLGDDDLLIGHAGNGSLIVSNGGTVSNGDSYLGYAAGGNGSALVSGAGSTWQNSTLTVGREGNGSLVVADGAKVTSTLGYIGHSAGSVGTVFVTGAGSAWTDMLPIEVGYAGTGVLTVADRGAVSAAEVRIGEEASGNGTVNVTSNATLLSDSNLFIGMEGKGALNITDGGQASARFAVVGGDSASSGSVLVDGPGSALNVIDPLGDDDLVVGYGGNGSLTVANGGNVTAGKVRLAYDAGSTGVLNIGSAAGNTPVAPGALVTPTIEFGDGTGSIVFNHNSSNYVFDAGINGGANNAAGSGTGLVGKGLVEAIAGRTIFNANHGDFTGTLQASNAGILQVNGDLSGGTANVLAGGRLEGNGTVGSTINAGTVAPGTASIGTLTVAGNYASNNGVLEIGTVLGNDASQTDKLVVTGDVSGSTMVKVTNLDGLGALTSNGIQIIQVDGSRPADAFTLSGDYQTESGKDAVIGGAYAYTLQPGGMQTGGDGNWYLVSRAVDGSPRYQPGVPLYEQYSPTLAALNTLPTMQQRIGNRYWSPTGQTGDATAQGAWVRVEGSKMSAKPAGTDAQAQRDIDLWKLQTGFDYMQKETANGLLVGGLNFVHGSASSNISSPYGRGKIDSTGTGFGATLTWLGNDGFYVDGQAQAMWFDSDISSSTIGRKLTQGNDGNGYALSVETGKRYKLSETLSLTPQAQLVWSQVKFDSFTDSFGTKVMSDDGDSLRMRAGVSLDHEQRWTAANGKESRVHLFGVANLYNEFLDGSQVSVAKTPFRTRDDRLWAGVGVGGSYEWNNGRYAVYGTADASSSLEHSKGNYTLGGTLGVRMAW